MVKNIKLVKGPVVTLYAAAANCKLRNKKGKKPRLFEKLKSHRRPRRFQDFFKFIAEPFNGNRKGFLLNFILENF